MSIKVKGFLKDVGGASRITAMRREMIQSAETTPHPQDQIRELADALHPGRQNFVVTQIRPASPTSRTFRLEPENGHIPPFQAGQYINFYLTIGSSTLTRAYSISSAPYEAAGDKPFVEITIRRNVSYFVPDYFFGEVKEGDVLSAAMPFGQFYYEPLRDAHNVVALAGGSGITPFVSMAKEIAAGCLDCGLTILFGSVKSDDIVCGEQLSAAERACTERNAGLIAAGKKTGGQVRVIHIMSDDPDWTGEKGFVTRELIEKYSCGIDCVGTEEGAKKIDTSYFFCGPLAMYRAVSRSMEEMGITLRRFRHDVMAQPGNVKQIPGFPEDQIGKTFQLTVVRGIQKDVIPARADEPVAVALERAAIPVDTHCRGGECGFCRSQLLSGDIFVSPLGDGRRREDKELGWFHACSAYPVSDLVVKIPII
ncbi:MAG: iron-sulfur cluster-binding domain-containing protein [Lachnospiraceae bacterium]|nr:iron-sulfur cluster-binding domain-containing protein [Lachnospiraceae bacterium]